MFRRALEDDDDVVKMVREALAIHPGVLADCAPREDSEGRDGEGLGEGTTSTLHGSEPQPLHACFRGIPGDSA